MLFALQWIKTVILGSLRIKQTRINRDKSRNLDFGIWTFGLLLWTKDDFMDFGLLLWTKDDSGLPTGPLTITKTLKTFL